MATETKNTKAFYNTEIPSDWEVRTLGEVATFINGKAYKQEELLSDGKYKVLRVGNFFTKGEWYFSDLELEDDKYVNDGDLMYAWSASFGPQFWKGEKTIYHYHIWKVIPSELITKQFLFFLLDYDTQRILSSKQGGTMFHITKGDMEKRKSNIPPLPEQKKIAQVLSTADAAIHTTEKLIAQKELRKKWLMQQLLSEKRIVKNEKWCKSGVRKVKLGDIASIKKGKPITEKEIHEGYYPIIAGGKTSPYSHNQFTDENVITISASGAYAGYVAFHPQKIWASDCSVVDELKGKSVIGYLYYQLIFHQEKIYKLQTGGAQPHVFPKDIFHFPLFIVHSIEEQTAIAQVLQAADKEISLLKAKAEKLREQKKGLMQVLLTGKVRMKVNE